MMSHALELIARHRSSGVYLDTNLMLMLVIGSYNPQRLQTFKRTKAYTPAEFRLLENIMNKFERRLTTPNILTEVDNLTRQLPEREHDPIALHIQRLVADMFEVYHESREHLGGEAHRKVGLTDAILIAQAEKYLIVTEDFPLASRIARLGRDVINFNHLRRYAE